MAVHSSSREETLVGVTRDPVLRPVGAVMAIVGAIWILFWGMAVEAGTLLQPILALALIFGGVVISAAGKPEIQI